MSLPPFPLYSLFAMVLLLTCGQPFESKGGQPPCNLTDCGAGGYVDTTNPAVDKDKSVLRRKEKESIEKKEAEAAMLSRKGSIAVQRVQAELDEIDRQVSSMRSRISTGSPRPNDRAETIEAMLAYRHEKVVQLEELRKKQFAEDRMRQEELMRLRGTFAGKWTPLLHAAVANYQKIATNKYLRNKRDAAWDELAAEFSEAREVKRHDAVTFLAKVGAEILPGLDQSCHVDQVNGLMWVKAANLAGGAMTWSEAVSWASALDYGGYSDWRLPTLAELMTLVNGDGQRLAENPKTNGLSSQFAGTYWSSTVNQGDSGSVHRVVNLQDGHEELGLRQNSYHVLPVRETGSKRVKGKLDTRD